MNYIAKMCAVAMLGLSALSASAATFVGDRNDFRDETIYFAMTTRFYDGDASNNTHTWDSYPMNAGDPLWRGDFKGLIQKLDYIKALGFTAIWITPVVENASGYDYHGYHASNFSKVDPRYESSDCTLQTLIDAVHAKGMKLIIDIVLNHTGNFGEENLCKLFNRNWDAPADINKSMTPYTKKDGGKLPDNYASLTGGLQYAARLAQMKNTDGVNHDTHNHWHHFGSFNWDDDTRWWAQIAGDCVDLNTENQAVADYLVKCYSKFIEMGCDGFRIDTGGHISRLTFNKNFLPQFTAAAEKYKAKRNNGPFFMFAEVCSRDRNVTYRNRDNLSCYFYTWKETKDYAWDTSTSSWDNVVVMEGEKGSHTNVTSVDKFASDYVGEHSDSRTSDNAFLNGNAYHTPDRSQYSGLSVIDFPMHWNFRTATEAFTVKSGDKYYNDASYNVVYVDSHDYAPDGAPESQRFAQSQDTWAENLSLMFSFRGIPCIYYGSEIEFRKGKTIDGDPNQFPRSESGRAYFGGYIKGSINVTDFATYSGATGNIAATLSHPLAMHIQRLNKIRAAVPALRKGQYSTTGCSGSFAFKRRYTDATTDSYALVTISGNATFTGIENGTYTDVITGDVKTVTNGSLTATCSGKGNMRIYVLSTSLTKAPGKIGEDGKYLYNTSAATVSQKAYDGTQEETTDDGTLPEDVGPVGPIEEPDEPITPSMEEGENAVFFENSSDWSGVINCYAWGDNNHYTGSWPGQTATYLGNKVWKFTYTGAGMIPDGAGLIFNNGSSQTGDLQWVNGGYYNASGYVKTIEGAGEVKPNPDPDPQPGDPTDGKYTVYFDNSSSSWGNVNVYIWDKGNSDKKIAGDWPGTAVTEKDPEKGYFKYSFEYSAANSKLMIIWNNGSTQTSDLELKNNAVYTSSGFKEDYSGVKALAADFSNLQIYARRGELIVISDCDMTLPVVRLDGTVTTVTIHTGFNSIALPSGFYIVAKNKVML